MTSGLHACSHSHTVTGPQGQPELTSSSCLCRRIFFPCQSAVNKLVCTLVKQFLVSVEIAMTQPCSCPPVLRGFWPRHLSIYTLQLVFISFYMWTYFVIKFSVKEQWWGQDRRWWEVGTGQGYSCAKPWDVASLPIGETQQNVCLCMWIS